jgi:hypothetical protein
LPVRKDLLSGSPDRMVAIHHQHLEIL